MTQHQQDDVTERMNEWFRQSFDLNIAPHLQQLDELADDVGATTGATIRTVYQLLKITKWLAVENDYARGMIDVVLKDFEARNGIEHSGNDLAVTFVDDTEHTRSSKKHVSIEKRSLADVVTAIDEVVAD